MLNHPPDNTPARAVRFHAVDRIDDDVPTWAWTYNHAGRVPIGAMTIAAGRPGVGKSTFARWFTAAVTTGTLPGCWHGTPRAVFYVVGEESVKYALKPSLRAAGADMSRVFIHHVYDTATGDSVPFQPLTDMTQIAEQCRAHDVALVVVDPITEAIGGGVDLYKNNEVRARLRPWAQLAESIDGVVLAIAHLNKAATGDVTAGINGSSAFGEVARAILGFARDGDDGDRYMSQAKNSLGRDDLRVTYDLSPTVVTTATGKTAEMPRFTITGDADRTVGDVLRANSGRGADDTDDYSEAEWWLTDYLQLNPGAEKRDVIAECNKARVASQRTLERAARRLGVVSTRTGFPAVACWSLPDASSLATHATTPSIRGETGETGATGADLHKCNGATGGRTTVTPVTPPPTDIGATGGATGPTPPDDVTAAIIDSLTVDHPLSLRALTGSIPARLRHGLDLPAHLDALTAAGMVAAHPNGYTLPAPPRQDGRTPNRTPKTTPDLHRTIGR